MAEGELDHPDFVAYLWRLGALVEGNVEQLRGGCVEFGAEIRPPKAKRHSVIEQ